MATELSPLDTLKNLAKVRPQDVVETVMRSPWSGGLQLALAWLRPGSPLFFNQRIGPHRRVHSVKVALQHLKDVKSAFGGTVNDVVLAVIAEAMARWLDERGEAVPRALRIFAPVSVRDDSHRYKLGNLVSGMVVEVPLAPMTLRERLNLVTAATGDLKRSRQAVAAHRLSNLANFAPATLQALAGRVVASQPLWSRQSVINLVATNIPGPQFPFYTGGAELLDVWPLVAIYHSLGLNVAIVSYNGSVHFGLLADRDLVPDLDEFGRHLGQTVTDFKQAAEPKPPVRSARRSSRPRKKAAKKAVDLRVDDQPVVAAPNGDRGNVRSNAAAKVHDSV
jgi:WS/DGAT/MGAT family acyltransferase